MVKTAQSVAHRLKEDESGEGSARNHIGIQDVGVKVGSGAASALCTARWGGSSSKGRDGR